MALDDTLTRIRGKLADRVEKRTRRAQEIALNLHLSAPRGGPNINYWGEQRSAENEQPAIEFGDFYDIMSGSLVVEKEKLRAAFVSNYVILEFGTRYMGPRPMGRMTIADLKMEVESGS